MHRYLLTAILISLFLQSPAQPQNLNAGQYRIIETESSGSCFSYEIRNADGNIVPLPVEVSKALDCPLILTLTPDGRELIYDDYEGLYVYRFAEGLIQEIYCYNSSPEGVSGLVFSEDGLKGAFAAVNQQEYKDNAEIVVFSFKASGIKILYNENAPIHFVCGSVCAPEAGTDIYFKDNNTLAYRRHEMLEEKPGETVYIKLP